MSFKLETILVNWGVWAAGHRWKTLLIALLITATAVVGLCLLHMEMTFYSIMPRSSEKVEDLRRITEEFPAASNIIIVIEGDNPADIREAVDAVTAELSSEQYEDIISGVRGRIDTETFSDSLIYMWAGDKTTEEFILPDTPKLMVSALNQELNELLASRDLSSLGKKQVNSRLKSLHVFLDAFSAEDKSAQTIAFEGMTDEILLPEPYFINDAQNMALVFVLPDFTVNDWLGLADNVLDIEAGVKQYEQVYNVSIGLTGLTVVAKDEAVTSEQGLLISSLFAFILIILLLILNFRMKTVPLLAGIPLLTGIFWTVGAAGFLLGRLNIMTAMYLVALLGLGIDVAIHYLTAFLQEREIGKSFQESIAAGIEKSGRGIVIGAVTTAIAFFALLTAESGLVRELAVIAGAGIICELLAMIILLPALLAFRDAWIRRNNRKDSIIKIHSAVSAAGAVGNIVSKIPLPFFMIFLIITVILSFYSPGVSVESNIMNMEAEGLESVALQERMIQKFDMAPDGLYIYSKSLSETRDIVHALEKADLIKEVDAVTSYVPDPVQQKELRDMLIQIISFGSREFDYETSENLKGQQLQGLQLEIGILIDNLRLLARRSGYPEQIDLENKLNSIFSDTQLIMTLYQELTGFITDFLISQLGADFITPESLPDDIRDVYFSKDSTANLITIIPKENLWEKENREALYAQLSPITDKATGMVMAADQMSRIAEEDGVKAAAVALALIFIILILDFRNIKLAILTILPLLASLFSLFGAMALLGIKFDFINIVAVPLLIGIGIDDAIHISHRYRFEGSGRMDKVIQKIGRAILMTTLTTIIGFASFIPSSMRAMRSTGIVLAIAMVFAFGFSIFMHSSLLIIVRERMQWSLDPWKRVRRR